MEYDFKDEIVQGYKIREAVHICGKDYVLAENPKAVQPYVTWQRTANDLISSYDCGHYFSNYLEAMIDLTERIRQEAQYILDYREEHNIETTPFTLDVCIPGSENIDYNGKFVLIKASALAPEYRIPSNQVYRAEGGFGCSPAGRGTKVYCRNIFDNDEQERWRRHDIAGIVDPAKLPEKFKERMALIGTKLKDSDLER